MLRTGSKWLGLISLLAGCTLAGCGGNGSVDGRLTSGGSSGGSSSGGNSAGTTTGNTSTGNTTSNTSGTTSSGTTSSTTTTTGGASGGSTTGACAADQTKAQQLPLDIYIMLDQSGSMSQNSKWTNVTNALNSFVQQQGLTGVSVGLQYFALPDSSSSSSCPATCGNSTDVNNCYNGGGYCDGADYQSGNCVGCSGSGSDSCNAADYATPAVEIAALPGAATAISNSISQHSPTTGTPTSAALQGAINHASSWAQSHQNHVVIDVLATDGEPEECDTSITDIDTIAASGVSASPKILTYVIGVGTSLSNLNSIAASGGTNQAFIVDDTSSNANQQFLDALNSIRGSALGCQYTIPQPDAGTIDYQQVNVQYTPGSGGAAQVIPYVTSQANCPSSGDAWYYDNAGAPTQIILCPSTCTTVSADSTGEVDILTGCSTIFK